MAAKDKSLKPIDSPIFGYWKALLLSFYSKRLYIDVGKNWRRLALLYFLFMIMVMSIPYSIKIGILLKRSFVEQIIEPLAKLPILYIQNGKVSVEGANTYVYKNKKGEVTLLIGEKQSKTDIRMKYPQLIYWFHGNKLTFYSPTPDLISGEMVVNINVSPYTEEFSQAMNIAFDARDFTEQPIVRWIIYSIPFLAYLVVGFCIFSMLATLLLVIAMMGQLFSTTFYHFKLSYATATRLLAVAATPMVFLLCLSLTFAWTFNGMGLLLIAVLIGYFSYGVYALKSESMRISRL